MSVASVRKLPAEVTSSVWYHVDAAGMTLGRLATRVATVLMGKHKPFYDGGNQVGDHVVITNAEQIAVTGRKAEQKVYRYHSHYPGGLKEWSYKRMLAEKPEKILQEAVSGMLPKNRLRNVRMGMLKVYEGPDHPHQAQQPTPLYIPHRVKPYE